MGQEEKISWERLQGETSRAFDAFRIYRDMGPERTVAKVAERMGKPPNYQSALWEWARKHAWTDRTRAYDDHLDRKARIAAEARIPEWEARRQTSLDQNLIDGSLIRTRLREMMAHPLTTQKTIEKTNGTHVTIIRPAGWNWSNIIAGVKMVAELEAATIAEGLMEADDEDFDPETATKEELVAFIAKYRKRKATTIRSSIVDARGDVAT